MTRYLRDRIRDANAKNDEQHDDFYAGYRMTYTEPELLPQEEQSQNPYDESYFAYRGVPATPMDSRGLGYEKAYGRGRRLPRRLYSLRVCLGG